MAITVDMHKFLSIYTRLLPCYMVFHMGKVPSREGFPKCDTTNGQCLPAVVMSKLATMGIYVGGEGASA